MNTKKTMKKYNSPKTKFPMNVKKPKNNINKLKEP